MPDSYEDINCIKMSPDQRFIIGTSSHEFFVYDILENYITRYKDSKGFRSCAFSNFNVAALGFSDGSCRLLVPDNDGYKLSEEIRCFLGTRYEKKALCHVAFSSDASFLLVCNDKAFAVSYKQDDYQKFHSFLLPYYKKENDLFCIQNFLISPDGTKLVINYGETPNHRLSSMFDLVGQRLLGFMDDICMKVDHKNRCFCPLNENAISLPNYKTCVIYEPAFNDKGKDELKSSTFIVPECFNITYQSHTIVNPLSIVLQEKEQLVGEEQEEWMLVQKKVSFEQLLYLYCTQ